MKSIAEILEEKGITLEEDALSAVEGIVDEGFVSREEYNNMLLEGKLSTALAGSGARSEKAILGFIDKGLLKLENGELTGFDAQLMQIKKEHGYLFENSQTSTGFSHQSGMSIDYDSLSDEEYYKLKERN